MTRKEILEYITLSHITLGQMDAEEHDQAEGMNDRYIELNGKVNGLTIHQSRAIENASMKVSEAIALVECGVH